MPPPLANLGPGDPFPTSRVGWNAIVQGGRNALRPLQGQDAPQEPGTVTSPSTVIYVTNTTTTDLPAFAVLALSTATVGIDPTVNPHGARLTPVFDGIVPTAYTNPFCILLEPCLVNQTARGAILGVVVCQVTISNTGDHLR